MSFARSIILILWNHALSYFNEASPYFVMEKYILRSNTACYDTSSTRFEDGGDQLCIPHLYLFEMQWPNSLIWSSSLGPVSNCIRTIYISHAKARVIEMSGLPPSPWYCQHRLVLEWSFLNVKCVSIVLSLLLIHRSLIGASWFTHRTRDNPLPDAAIYATPGSNELIFHNIILQPVNECMSHKRASTSNTSTEYA